jgi:hypothetical protein
MGGCVEGVSWRSAGEFEDGWLGARIIGWNRRGVLKGDD